MVRALTDALVVNTAPFLGPRIGQTFQTPLLAVAPPSILLIGHERVTRAGLYTPHIRLLLAPVGFAKNRANGQKEPGARGGAGSGAGRDGAGRAEVTVGEARLDLPASFHRVGPSGGGSPPPPARRRGAEPDSGEATLAARVASARGRAARSRAGG